jgi:hypothetical protein
MAYFTRSLFLSLSILLLYALTTIGLVFLLGGASYGEVLLGDLFVKHLILLDILCAFPAIFVCGGLGALAVGRQGGSWFFRWLYRSCLAILIWFLVIGWAHFVYADKFPGWDTYAFYACSPIHLLEHALAFSPVGSCCIVVIWVGLVIFTAWLSPWSLTRLSGRVQLYVVLLILMSIGVACLLYWPGDVLGIKGTEIGRSRFSSSDYRVRTSTIEDFLESYLLEKSAPATSLCLPLFRSKRHFYPSSTAFDLEWRERFSLDVYADSARVNLELKSLPNVIVVLVESLRRDVLFSQTDAVATMPQLESLAQEGAFFSRHYSSSSHSSYSDISVISGIYPLWGNRIHIYPKQAPDYPRPRIYDVLTAIGMDAAIFSSQNENWGGMLDYLQSDALDIVYHAGELTSGEDLLGRSLPLNGGKGFDRDTIEVALNWMHSREVPFFAYLNLQGSHYPYYFPDSEIRPFGEEFDGADLNFLNLPPEVIPIVRPRYRDSLYYIDQQLGHLVSELKKTGRWNNTLIIVTGDTGQAFGEHGFTGHARDLYDEVVRTPLILAGGALKYSGNYELLSQHVDIAPTILGLLDLPAYSGFQGFNLFGPNARTWAPLVCQSPALKQVGMVTKKWKLMLDWNTGNYRLYDVEQNPEENILIEASQTDCFESLQEMLNTWVFYQLEYYASKKFFVKYFAPDFSNSIPCR